jgi:uncharacterized membrane protein (DUF485 family)
MAEKSALEIAVTIAILLVLVAVVILFLMNTGIATDVFGKISVTSGIVNTLLTLLGIGKGLT